MSNKRPAKGTEDKIEELVKNGKDTLPEENKKPVDYSNEEINGRIVKVYEENAEENKKMRKKYATILIAVLIIELAFLNHIFVDIGMGTLKYSEVTLNIFITGGIAEVFILIRTIIKYLFTDKISESLNIILGKNIPINLDYSRFFYMPKKERV